MTPREPTTAVIRIHPDARAASQVQELRQRSRVERLRNALRDGRFVVDADRIAAGVIRDLMGRGQY